jgi:hypothetical protein
MVIDINSNIRDFPTFDVNLQLRGFQEEVKKKFGKDPLEMMKNDDIMNLQEPGKKSDYLVSVDTLFDQKVVLCRKYFPHTKFLHVIVLFSPEKKIDGKEDLVCCNETYKKANQEALKTLNQIAKDAYEPFRFEKCPETNQKI